MAVTGAKLIGDLASAVTDTEIIHEYSAESFTGTDLKGARQLKTVVMAALDEVIE
jgi:2-isopropylmalate synthase